MNHRVVDDMLRMADFQIDEAGDALTSILTTKAPDHEAMLLDLPMPGVDGIKRFIQFARAMTPEAAFH